MAVVRNLAMVATIIGLGTNSLWAEEEEDQPIEGKASAIIMAGSSEGGAFTIEMATPMGTHAFGGGATFLASPMMMSGGVTNNSIGWLSDEDILNELDIVEEQREQLRRIREQETKKRQEFFNTIRGMEPAKMGEFVREFGTMLKADVDKQVKEVLLPHQAKRLEQIRLQTSMRGMGSRALESEALAKALGITDEQKQKMREKEKEVREQLQKKLEQLRKEAQDEVLSVLTDAQRKKLTMMLGEDYEFKPRQFTFPKGRKPTAETKKE
jgi:Spy/CpxP family protein refolding chaperone